MNVVTQYAQVGVCESFNYLYFLFLIIIIIILFINIILSFLLFLLRKRVANVQNDTALNDGQPTRSFGVLRSQSSKERSTCIY